MSGPGRTTRAGRQRVCVVTGSRAEFGLLAPVMRAVREHPALELVTVAAGSHLVGAEPTVGEVRRAFEVHAEVPMQREGEARTRLADAAALGRGILGFAETFGRLRPGVVVVLGDRIEAFAAASAASVGGIVLAHIHGGDRAEGVADEAMRHAITKLAHVHFAATDASRERILRMGERAELVFNVGSPAVDGLDGIPAMDEARYAELGRPEVVFLMHPVGRSDEQEEPEARGVLEGVSGWRVLALEPNLDSGREGIVRAIGRAESHGLPAQSSGRTRGTVRTRDTSEVFSRAGHLERREFVGLLRRAKVLVGNSSAGLIEAAVVGCPAVDIGTRQGGRERAGNVVWVERGAADAVRDGVERAVGLGRGPFEHPYGDGRAGERISGVLAGMELGEGAVRKRCVY